jgi:subtilisin family serine protease
MSQTLAPAGRTVHCSRIGRPGLRRHADRRLDLVLERLESRALLSGDVGSGLASLTSRLDWSGQTVDVRSDRWIVRTSTPVSTASLSVAAGWETMSLGDGFLSLRAPGAGVGDVLGWASRTPGVLYAEPDFVIAPKALPNDPSFGQLWGLNNTGQSGGVADADIDAPEAWNTTTGSRSVVVAVIDTGIDYTHPDLAANAWRNPGEIAGDGIDNDRNGFVDDVYGWDFANNDANPMDDNGHGTHVSGTIGGVGNNGVGVAGVNWQVSIMGLKFLDGSGSGSTSAAIAAVNYATRMRRDFGINVVATNNSWGGGGFSTALRDAIDAGGRAGILFVAAAGNEATNIDTTPSYPAGYAGTSIISVAATDRSNQVASFSNVGATNVDLAAPGVSIYSTVPGNRYASYSGTSMATPHVTGTVALLAAARPTATAAEIRAAILAGASPVASLAGKVATGGLLNVDAALRSLLGTTPVTPPPVTPPPVEPPPVTPPSAGPLEPNDSLSTATAVALANGRSTSTATIGDGQHGQKDVDLYAITLAAGSRLTIDVDARSLATPSTLDSYLRLFDSTGRQLATNDDTANSLDSLLVFTAPGAGTYYVGVSSYGNSTYAPATAGSGATGRTTGDYVVAFTVDTPPLQADIVDVAPDPRTTAVDSITITFTRPVTGFDLADLRLLRSGRAVPLTSASLTSTDGLAWTLAGITAATGSTGSYSLQLVASGSGIVDSSGRALSANAADSWLTTATLVTDVGDATGNALRIPEIVGEVRVSGQVGDGRFGSRDVDLYRVTLAANQRLTIDVDARSLAGSSTLDSYLRVFDASGRQLAFNDDANGSLDSYLVFTSGNAGVYYIGVSGYGNSAYSPRAAGSGRSGSTGVYQLAMWLTPGEARPGGRDQGIRMLGFADDMPAVQRRAVAAVFSAIGTQGLSAAVLHRGKR